MTGRNRARTPRRRVRLCLARSHQLFISTRHCQRTAQPVRHCRPPTQAHCCSQPRRNPRHSMRYERALIVCIRHHEVLLLATYPGRRRSPCQRDVSYLQLAPLGLRRCNTIDGIPQTGLQAECVLGHTWKAVCTPRIWGGVPEGTQGTLFTDRRECIGLISG